MPTRKPYPIEGRPRVTAQLVLPDGKRMAVPLPPVPDDDAVQVLQRVAAYLIEMQSWGIRVVLAGSLDVECNWTVDTLSLGDALARIAARDD